MTPRRHKGDGGVYQRSDGRWMGVVEGGYVGGVRKRRTVSAATKRELMPKLARLRKEVEAGLRPESWTVARWLEHWLDRIAAKELAPRTLARYRGDVNNHLIPHLGRRKLPDLRVVDVTDMLDAMEDAGLSDASRRHARAVLRSALEAAVQHQLVAENVAARTKPPRGKGEHAALSITQARVLLDAAPTSADAARWWLALQVGLRQGEALGLRWEDVHLDEQPPWVLIHQQAQAIPGQGMVIRSVPKSKKARVVALTPEPAQALRAWRQEGGGVGFVFGGDHLIRPERDYALWQEALASVGLPRVPLHGARRTAAVWLDAMGLAPRTVSDMLGHAGLDMTSRAYHHTSVELQGDAIRRALGPVERVEE